MNKTQLLRIMSVLESDPDGQVYDELDHAYNIILGYVQRNLGLSAQRVFDEMKSLQEADAILRKQGYDPVAVGELGKAFAEKALADNKHLWVTE